MKQGKTRVLICVAAVLMAASGLAHAAGAMKDLDASDRAKVMKEKVKQNNAKAALKNKGDEGERVGECGSQTVGSVFTDGGNAPKEVVTIITGDVININDGKCK